MSLNLLVVEDDNSLRDALLVTLEAAGYQAQGVDGGKAALALMALERFNMVISDLRMSPMDGLSLLAEIRYRHPGVPVLLMTAFGDVDKAVAAMRGGACDFMLKPFEPKALIEQIARYADHSSAIEHPDVVAADPRTQEVLMLAARVAKTDATVMMSGESGVGKEVFARFIHDQSARNAGPFVAINCAAIPDSLLEATLFGYEKGAFTGAQTAQSGKFEQANGGTLMLDEISEMPMALQAKLLRVLQEREVERVGGKKTIALDIRVIATSNRDMAAEVANGRFREDLYYRLNVFPLRLPPLRERPADIVPLTELFLARHAPRNGKIIQLTEEVKVKVAAYPWPGNVRELENAVQRALILADDAEIRAEHLLPEHSSMNLPARPLTVASASSSNDAALAVSIPTAPSATDTAAPQNIKDFERQHILETLAQCGGSRTKAIAILGISERTLRNKLKQYKEEGYI